MNANNNEPRKNRKKNKHRTTVLSTTNDQLALVLYRDIYRTRSANYRELTLEMGSEIQTKPNRTELRVLAKSEMTNERNE